MPCFKHNHTTFHFDERRLGFISTLCEQFYCSLATLSCDLHVLVLMNNDLQVLLLPQKSLCVATSNEVYFYLLLLTTFVLPSVLILSSNWPACLTALRTTFVCFTLLSLRYLMCNLYLPCFNSNHSAYTFPTVVSGNFVCCSIILGIRSVRHRQRSPFTSSYNDTRITANGSFWGALKEAPMLSLIVELP